MKFKKEDLIKLYVNMVRAEAYDQWLTRKSLTGEMKATYHPVWGDYAAGVAGCTFLKPDDVIYPHHRGHGLPHLIGKGVEIRRFIADQFGKATGSCNGFGTMAHQIIQRWEYTVQAARWEPLLSSPRVGDWRPR